jgi:peptidoglycan/LPS O-acetylase OafA/YrhL
MVYEFYGSLVVFGIVLLAVRRTPTARRTLLLHATLAIIMTFICAVLVPFVAGSYLAYRSSLRQPGFELSPRTTAVLFVGAVIGFSTDAWLANTLAALFVMLGLLGSRPLAARLSGRVGVVLGTLSFPLYLVHALVILSASSFVYARATALAAPEYAVLALTLVTTILLSAIVAWPFVLLDSFCLARINAAASRLAIRLMAPYQRGIGALPPT